MNYWLEKIKIGSLTFPRFIGGPLDGITDSPFRKLVRNFSKDELLYTEMRHVGCVANDKTGRLSLNFAQLERPLNYQISANSIEFIDQACDKILAAGVDMVDLNVGCPARCVVKSGSGSALMADLPKLEKILKHLRQRLPIPFTVKIRSGFKEVNAVTVAKLIQDCGADALAIHPRLQTQAFAGRPDYTIARDVKKAVTIPVFLSGNIINWATAKMAYEQTGVDGYLIGRGIWSKPWKLAELDHHARGVPFEITNAMVFSYALRHLDLMLEHYGMRGLYNFRKHLPFYLRGLPAATQLRKNLVITESVDEVRQAFQHLMGA